MRLIFSKQLNQLVKGAKLASMAGLLGMGLLAPTAFCQEVAPAYTPGSVSQTPPLSLLEKGKWTPPETDVQSSPSDWVPPETDAKVQELVVESEAVDQPFAPLESESLIEPPPEDTNADLQVEAPANPDFLPSSSENTVSPSVMPIHSDSTLMSSPTEVLGTSVLTESPIASELSVLPDGSEAIANEFYGDGEFVTGCEATVGSCSEDVIVEGSVCQPDPSFAKVRRRPIRDLFGKGRAAFSEAGTVTGQTGTFDQPAFVDQGSPSLGTGRARAALGQARAAVGQVGAAVGQRTGLNENAVVQPGFTPVRNILRGVGSRLGANTSVNSIGQLTFLSFGRDYRTRGRQLSRGIPNLFANGPDENEFTGVDFSYGQRRAGGRGWEWRFIGFNPGRATDVAGASPQLVWGGLAPPLNDPATWPSGVINPNTPETFGLSGLGLNGVSMADIFGDAQNHRVSRDSEFGSFELNMLRAATGGSRLTCGSSMLEVFGGFRAVAFNETMVFTAAATQSAVAPASAYYASEVKNGLFGLQVGGRLERPLRSPGWGMSFGTRVGIYNNRVESRQNAQYQFDDGSRPTPLVLYGEDAGRAFDVSAVDHELAFLGELDFGLIYRFRPQTRARFGFRGLAVTNVATAGGQLEDSLFDLDRVAEPNVLGDLIVGGLYFGVDHAF